MQSLRTDLNGDPLKMFSGLDALLQAAQFLEQQEQHHRPTSHRLSSEVSIIPTSNTTQQQQNGTNSSTNSVHTNSSSNSNAISFIPSSTGSSVTNSVSENRFIPPIGKISNGTVILTASGTSVPNGLLSNGSAVVSSPARIVSPMNGGSATSTTTAVVTGLVPQGTTAYLTTSSNANSNLATPSSIAAVVSSTTSSPRHQSAGYGTGTAIIPLLSGSRKRTISNASSHSSGGHSKDEPLVNGHSTAPPLVVISTNASSSTLQKHHAVSSLTIDLSTKSNSNSSSSSSSTGIIGHRLSSTPPSSGCSSSSSTLTISPVDDSQSSLNLSGGSTSGYITSHSANSSSSLNLSGSSPLPVNGSVIATSHGSNSSPLPHDLVIVQQQQINHLVQAAAGQTHHGLTSTSTLLNHIPTGGRRRTTSSNSNGSVGTREVHNKLEKNRRAHLKECFEQLKKQLTLQPDEKKTSNLSILDAAIRYIKLLKVKERDSEHEMERLAKEKIAYQNRILVLKRELSQWRDVNTSPLAPDTDAIPNSSNGGTVSIVQSDRDLLNDLPGRNGIRYSSSSSLSSVATTASIGNLPLQTTISPVLIAASSPSRASPPSLSTNRNSSSPASGSMPMPLSLTTRGTTAIVSETHNSTPSSLKFSTTSLPNGLNLSTTTNGLSNGGSSSSGSNCSTPSSTTGGAIVTNGINAASLPLIVNANNLSSLSQSQLFTPVTATILTTGNGTAIQTLPLNLNVASSISNGHHLSASVSSTSSPSIISTSNGLTNSSGLQIIGTTANGTTIPANLISSTTGKELLNGTTLTKNGFRTDSNKIEIIATQSAAGSALEPPATKVIKLVNGNTLVGVTSIDKDKMMLSQVVPQGGLVVSPIQLLTSPGLRVIQQAPNGLATIELSTAANVQPQSNQVQRTTGGSSFHSSTNNLSHLTSTTSQPSNQSISSNHNHLPQPTNIHTMTNAQLHKLLMSSSTGSSNNGITTISSTGSLAGYSNGSSPTTTITSELARLPGGAELNILPAGTNGATALPLYRATTGQGGKLTFVNAISTGSGTGLTLKGTDNSTGTGRTTALHVVTPIPNSAQLSGLTPVVVSRYDQDAPSHMIGPFTTSAAATGPPQTTQLGKVGALVSRN
ncbi:mucin-5AC-like isoform X6 [Armigeres subalbatus]|uniref:mucin-5AC-like isoform X6 n=1 Tax=Armigeres subalbatus TaxID=124917 RepID=UPI002ED433F8